MRFPVTPNWMTALSLQQQSVVLLAARGPDGVAKEHPCKVITKVYRGTVFVQAKIGRLLEYGEKGDTFACLEPMLRWNEVVKTYLLHVDSLPHHYHMHLMHGAQIIGYKHPNIGIAGRWQQFYYCCCEDLHLTEESQELMDARLNDFNREDWE